jgi:transcriptional regulator with XRE-family HTH domain
MQALVRCQQPSNYERLREQGKLTKQEAAQQLGIHEATLSRWATNGLVTKHAYNGHAHLYELPDAPLPTKHSSR